MNHASAVAVLLTTSITLAAAFALTACAGNRSADANRQNMSSSIFGTWTPVEIDGAAAPDLAPPRARPPFITFAESGQVTGRTGVNVLSGQTDASGLKSGTVSLDRLITTKMAGSPEAMAVESRFLGALGKARAFRTTPESLELLDASGQPVARFRRTEAPQPATN